MDVFRGGYGVLKLHPTALYRLLPGEYADMIAAHAWRHGAQQARTMPPEEWDAKRKQFDAMMARRARG